MSVKAIQTTYKGYNFRSRLEARWAVFFDACGYPWEYEPEGFDLNGIYYLPDFKLEFKDDNGDHNRFWFEIKPAGPISETEATKIKAFSDAVSEQAFSEYGAFKDEDRLVMGYGDFIVLEGPPTDYKLYQSCVMSEVDGSKFVIEPIYRGRPSFWNNEDDVRRMLSHSTKAGPTPATKARSARFEHGGSGASL